MEDRSRRVCPVEMAGALDNIFRKWGQNPKRILGNYIHKGMVVLDIGCGSGFFSTEIADMVGEQGRVIAADLQQGMLEKLKNKIKGTEIEKRIKLHKCEKDKLGVSEKVNFVLAFYVVHEIPNLKSFLKEINSILKPNGKFFVVEPQFHVSRQDFEKMIKEFVAAGFQLVEKPKIFISRAAIFKI